MIDALLYAVRDLVRGAGFDYSQMTCEVMGSPEPKANCGDVWLSVHQSSSSMVQQSLARLDEMFGFGLTLTMRVRGISPDRIGDQFLAKKVAQNIGFNRRAEQLRAFLHENWALLYYANNYLVQYAQDAEEVYGFAEPPRYQGMEMPVFVGGEWFSAQPEAQDVGMKAELRFGDCRRLQALASYV